MSDQFMRRAIELALDNIRAGGGPFGAVIAKGARIIAQGANRVTTTNDPTAHAEVVAIREACRALKNFQLEGCELYTTCEPCPMCLGAIQWARLARIHYACTRADAAAAGFDDRTFHEEVTRPAERRAIEIVGEGREHGLEVFRAWLAKADRRAY